MQIAECSRNEKYHAMDDSSELLENFFRLILLCIAKGSMKCLHDFSAF